MLEAGNSFATETVFSHPSKLDIIDRARARGYIVIVMHVGIESPDLSVARVKARVQESGHDVPEDKIRARFDRGQPLIREAVLRADRGMVFETLDAMQYLTSLAVNRNRKQDGYTRISIDT